ncbi:sensor histidine kinase [Ornithinibacillus halotolerans]|uniref:histidine kinase n=1 Tax=Ornithinibacillus halotolerans TaxID=1274357 RepID=A0A916SAB6_9BACI|nr:sensor histidine kinase [Ornithinibacillus halotolerans]GGA90882.1 sensor protein BceS [Ornithinibacillus halotolerans]
MIKDFIVERLTWILFIGMLLGLFLLVGYLDPSLHFNSILYVVFLSLILFLLFLFIQYRRESSYYRRLKDWDPQVDMEIIQDGNTPFERIVEHAIKQQVNFSKHEISRHIIHIEQEKDELLAWIHEVKTPLTTIKLMLEKVEDQKLKEQLMFEWLRIHLLLDQQLHHRRLPSMENDLYIEQIDIERIITQEIQGLKSWCFQKGIGFDLSLDKQMVLSDSKWLPFIIRQILTNAVKYSEQSDVEITSFSKNGHVVLTIRDYGRGIAVKDLPRIFEKGFTSTTDHKDHQATGMGLFLTKKVSQALKIKITIDSSYGKGTTVSLIFPRKNDFLEISSM